MFNRLTKKSPAAPIDTAKAVPEQPTLPEKKTPIASNAQLQTLTTGASRLGYEIVDISGFLDDLKSRSETQIDILRTTQMTADELVAATGAASDTSAAVKTMAEGALALADRSVETMQHSSARSADVAGWVASAAERIEELTASLNDVDKNNQLVGEIAAQVKLLSINARIEASRSGEAGKGFAIIAQEVHEMANRTNQVADHIRRSVAALSDTVSLLAKEAGTVRGKADQVIADSETTSASLGEITGQIKDVHSRSVSMAEETERARTASSSFTPAFNEMRHSIQGTSGQISDVSQRTQNLIDTTEIIVRSSVLLGGASADLEFIEKVQDDAATLSDRLEKAVSQGRIRLEQLFSRDYQPIPNTRPQQVMAPCTQLTDELFPVIQEAALEYSNRIVFCAAVNIDGYLPTHNRKFSQTQGEDEAWNTANCRNRRIFDDRVGLKAGRNIEPFLLQVYRRDMGGGVFKLMKDVSAPITVRGRHWGGLRLAYSD